MASRTNGRFGAGIGGSSSSVSPLRAGCASGSRSAGFCREELPPSPGVSRLPDDCAAGVPGAPGGASREPRRPHPANARAITAKSTGAVAVRQRRCKECGTRISGSIHLYVAGRNPARPPPSAVAHIRTAAICRGQAARATPKLGRRRLLATCLHSSYGLRPTGPLRGPRKRLP